jgi:hypothetical protein
LKHATLQYFVSQAGQRYLESAVVQIWHLGAVDSADAAEAAAVPFCFTIAALSHTLSAGAFELQLTEPDCFFETLICECVWSAVNQCPSEHTVESGDKQWFYAASAQQYFTWFLLPVQRSMKTRRRGELWSWTFMKALSRCATQRNGLRITLSCFTGVEILGKQNMMLSCVVHQHALPVQCIHAHILSSCAYAASAAGS